MQKGVIIRHLVLPGQKEDSLQLIKWMAEELPEKQFISVFKPVYAL